MSAYRTYRTAGPWFVGHAIKNGQLAIIGDVDSVVALLPDESMGCTLNEPNARLIAKAPEMLDMLIDIRADLACLPRALGYDFTYLPKLDALIADAEGETP